MERVDSNHFSRKWLADANAALISAVCHLLAVLALALVTVATDYEGAISLWIAPADSVGDSLEHDLGAFQLEPSEQELQPAGELSNTLELAALPTEHIFFDTNLLAHDLQPNAIGGAQLEGTGGEAGSARGAGTGTGTGMGAGTGGAKFFGIGSRGKSFVYVIDFSTSMTEMNKFEHAKAELLRSLRGLRSGQRYYIVLFSDGAYPMDGDEPVLATEANIAQTKEWLNSLRPNGTTNPLSALRHALSMKPNGIYFLSDGLFDLSVIDVLRTENQPRRERIPIHTISFYNRETEGLMKMIARNSGGEYKFVQPKR